MSSTALTDSLLVFVVATFLGLDVIRRVSPLLHTPLMSLTNAISAISVVGSIGLAGSGQSHLATVLGTVAIASSMANVVGGFWITDRMLKMFKPRTPAKPAGAGKAASRTGAAS